MFVCVCVMGVGVEMMIVVVMVMAVCWRWWGGGGVGRSNPVHEAEAITTRPTRRSDIDWLLTDAQCINRFIELLIFCFVCLCHCLCIHSVAHLFGCAQMFLLQSPCSVEHLPAECVDLCCSVSVHGLVGLVVRRPPRERKVPGSNPACAGIFSGSSHTSD